MPASLRRLFATILVFHEPGDVRGLWDRHLEAMSDDYRRSHTFSKAVEQMVLLDIRGMLQSMGKDIALFPLPDIDDTYDTTRGEAREVTEESTIEVDAHDAALASSLNHEQRLAYDEILAAVDAGDGGVFFVDGPGGTGKTFLYRALLAKVRGEGKIAVATATSCVAASIMPGGRTTHSRFMIPLNIEDGASCSFTKQSGTTKLLRIASLILWDEATMTNRQAVEALDNSMRDIMGRRHQPFGGKTVVFGGDFRQVLPVVRKGSRGQIIDATLRSSYLWKDHNMSDPNYMTSRAILSTKNNNIDKINTRMIERFQGEDIYHSFDSAEDDPHGYYAPEFLNNLTPNGLPPHALKLKINCPIILLRNIDPTNGLCNGTRLVVRGFQRNAIDAEIVLGQHAGRRVFLPRIPLCPSDDDIFPFKFKRKQFPIRLTFAMTINKAQGQTIPIVGVYLPDPIFSHGHIYVALSRATTKRDIKILAINDADKGKGKGKEQSKNLNKRKRSEPLLTTMKNIVYKEVLSK
uniref:ATP-dependent DNA helicase n=2 Tax=Hordeum vulgare subsp. vulgare TaxID=112509 RepID=A0A8I6XFF0_HORVV